MGRRRKNRRGGNQQGRKHREGPKAEYVWLCGCVGEAGGRGGQRRSRITETYRYRFAKSCLTLERGTLVKIVIMLPMTTLLAVREMIVSRRGSGGLGSDGFTPTHISLLSQIESMDAKLAALIRRLNDCRRRRALLLGFAHSPVDMTYALLAAQVGTCGFGRFGYTTNTRRMWQRRNRRGEIAWVVCVFCYISYRA